MSKFLLILIALFIAFILAQFAHLRESREQKKRLSQRGKGHFINDLSSLESLEQEICLKIISCLENEKKNLSQASPFDKISELVSNRFFKHEVYSFISTLEKDYEGVLISRKKCEKKSVLELAQFIKEQLVIIDKPVLSKCNTQGTQDVF